MIAEEAAFITDRESDALANQRSGIANTITTMIGQKPPQTAVNYDGAQKGATFGSNSGKVLAPELLSTSDSAVTTAVAEANGGLAKLGSLNWGGMESDLKSLWIAAYQGDTKAAELNWTHQLKITKTLATNPDNKDAVDPAKFDAYSDLATTFPKPMMGCMGFANDYKNLTMAQAIDDFGLDKSWHPHGGFIITIPAAQVAEAVANAQDAGGTMGKASVFSSLMRSEFNYIVEDRAFNTTELGDKDKNSNAKQNSGAKCDEGKGEVMVNGFQPADFFKQSPKVIF
jgi:hypothetical protein